jgi:aminoglycoside 3-N-acetyltransferase I
MERQTVQIHVEPVRDTSFLVAAHEEGERIGFVLVHELPRLSRGRSMFLVYDVDVVESHRRRGVATAMLRRVEEIARARGVVEGFVLTEPDNDAANRLYESLGGVRSDVVMWDFEYTDD